MTNKNLIKAQMDIKMYQQTRALIEHLIYNMESNLGEAIYETLEEIARDSRENYVPVKTGRLRSSIHATIPTYMADGEEAAVVAQVWYSGIVHEKHPTKSLYIETPFMQAYNSGAMGESLMRKILVKSGFNP